MLGWHELPGARAFFRQVVEDLTEGESVVIFSPTTLRCDWRERLTTVDRTKPWDALRSRLSASCDIEATMAEEYLPAVPARGELLSQLTVAPQLAGSWVLVDGVSAVSWPSWSRFLQDWGSLVKAIPAYNRPLFCVVLVGASPLPRDAALDGVRIRYWSNVFSESDIELYAYASFADAPLSALERRVAAAVAASIAQWDPMVVDALRDESLGRVFDPSPTLQRVAKEYEWNRADLDAQGPCWRSGQCDVQETTLRVHASVKALLGQRSAVDRLVWRGQVKALIPFIEEVREDYLHVLGRSFVMPHVTPAGDVVNQVEHLDLGMIKYQVERHRLPLHPVLRDGLGPLKQIRDSLAHLRHIDALELCQPQILALANSERLGTSQGVGELPPGAFD